MLMADAKPFWSALFHSLTPTDTEDCEYRRGSIYQNISAMCRLNDRGKILKANDLGGQEGSLTPAASLFRAAYYQCIPLSFNSLTLQSGPSFVPLCDQRRCSPSVRPKSHPCRLPATR